MYPCPITHFYQDIEERTFPINLWRNDFLIRKSDRCKSIPSRFRIALMKFKVSVFRSSEPNKALKNTSLRRFKWIISGISDVGIVITSPLILSLACCNVNQDYPVKGQKSILTITFMIITPVSYHFSKDLPSASIFKRQEVSAVNGRSPIGKLLDGWHFLPLPWPCEGCLFSFLLRLIKT